MGVNFITLAACAFSASNTKALNHGDHKRPREETTEKIEIVSGTTSMDPVSRMTSLAFPLWSSLVVSCGLRGSSFCGVETIDDFTIGTNARRRQSQHPHPPQP